MVGSFIRRFGFWALDFLQGGKKIKHLIDIKTISTAPEGADHKLDRILNYAINNVPYYSNILKASLEYFPVMSKSSYREGGDNCFSKEFVSRKSVLHKVSTSGSTGMPMTFYQDSEKRNRVVVDLINAHKKIGWNLGDNYIFIRNWSPNYKHSRLKSLMQNVTVLSIADFDDAKKQWLTKYLMKKKAVLFGYSSAICDYLFFLENTHNTSLISPKLIVCDSDELTGSNKRKLHDRFKCPVINRYDNEENGLLAITSAYDDVFTVNNQSLKIELLSIDSNERVKPGEVGRVIVTDYYNKAMPMIRYDTGDLAISYDAPDNIRHLEKLCGRTAVSLTSTSGLKISSVAICAITEVFNSIVKYQLIQKNKTEFVFRYIGELSDDDRCQLLIRLKSTLGEDASIIYEQVSELKCKSNGKFASIINEYIS